MLELAADEQWQADVYGYVDSVMSAAKASASFTGGAWHYSTRSFTVYGARAEPPDDVAALMASAPPEVAMRWEEVPYTEAQLEAAVDSVPLNAQITAAGISPDFRGLQLTRRSNQVNVPKRVKGVPVQAVGIGHMRVASNARGLDGGPFRGGQRTIVSALPPLPPREEACSTGFRVFRGY